MEYWAQSVGGGRGGDKQKSTKEELKNSYAEQVDSFFLLTL